MSEMETMKELIKYLNILKRQKQLRLKELPELQEECSSGTFFIRGGIRQKGFVQPEVDPYWK